MPMLARMAAGLAAAALIASPMAGWAQPAPPPSAAEFTVAQSKVVARKDKAMAGQGTLPRLADPVDGPMLRASMDYRALPALDFSSLASGIEICARALSVTGGYYTIGGQAQTSANLVEYRDELSLGFSFIVDCFGRLLVTATDFWNANARTMSAKGRAGMIQARDGAAGLYESAVGMLTESHYSLDNKKGLLAALARNAPVFAATTTPAQRLKIRASIDAALRGAPAVLQPELTRMRSAFELTTCTGPCEA